MKKRETKYDELFKRYHHLWNNRKALAGIWQQEVYFLGCHFIQIISRRDGGHILGEMSKALKHWNRPLKPKSRPQEIRDCIADYQKMFKGKRKQSIVDGKVVRGEMFGKLTYKSLIENLEIRGIKGVKKSELRRAAREMGEEFKDTKRRQHKKS